MTPNGTSGIDDGWKPMDSADAPKYSEKSQPTIQHTFRFQQKYVFPLHHKITGGVEFIFCVGSFAGIVEFRAKIHNQMT